MKIKEKAKAYWEEHKVEITAYGVVIGTGVVGTLMGYFIGRHVESRSIFNSKWYVKNERIADFLQDAKNVYPTTFTMADCTRGTGFTLNQLGDIGKEFIDMGAPGDSKSFTHILMIGPDKK